MANAIEAISATSSLPDTLEIPQIPSTANDSVQLSIPYQVNLLAQQGVSISQIAAELGLPTAEVMDDLSITAVNASSGPSGI
jgi:hypothetical protein